MDYLHRVFIRNSYLDWMIYKIKKEPSTPMINPDTGLEVKKNVFISAPYFPDLSEKFRRIFQHTSVPVIFKGVTSLKSILMHPKDKLPSQLKQNVVYKWSCPEENSSLSYIGESSRCLENAVKEHKSHVTSAVYKHRFPTTTPESTPPTSI